MFNLKEPKQKQTVKINKTVTCIYAGTSDLVAEGDIVSINTHKGIKEYHLVKKLGDGKIETHKSLFSLENNTFKVSEVSLEAGYNQFLAFISQHSMSPGFQGEGEDVLKALDDKYLYDTAERTFTFVNSIRDKDGKVVIVDLKNRKVDLKNKIIFNLNEVLTLE